MLRLRLLPWSQVGEEGAAALDASPPVAGAAAANTFSAVTQRLGAPYPIVTPTVRARLL